jgi:hypothetical protein
LLFSLLWKVLCVNITNPNWDKPPNNIST